MQLPMEPTQDMVKGNLLLRTFARPIPPIPPRPCDGIGGRRPPALGLPPPPWAKENETTAPSVCGGGPPTEAEAEVEGEVDWPCPACAGWM